MDAGIADALNRLTAILFARRFDEVAYEMQFADPWYHGPMAASLMGENGATDADRAWLVGAVLSNRTSKPGIDYSSYPADSDWDSLFSNIRAEIEARRARDPQTPPAKAAENQLAEVV